MFFFCSLYPGDRSIELARATWNRWRSRCQVALKFVSLLFNMEFNLFCFVLFSFFLQCFRMKKNTTDKMAIPSGWLLFERVRVILSLNTITYHAIRMKTFFFVYFEINIYSNGIQNYLNQFHFVDFYFHSFVANKTKGKQKLLNFLYVFFPACGKYYAHICVMGMHACEYKGNGFPFQIKCSESSFFILQTSHTHTHK